MKIIEYNWLIFIAMGIVLAILIAGIINLAFKGPKSASRSNKLMRMRVIAQFIAVVLIMVGFWFKTKGQ